MAVGDNQGESCVFKPHVQVCSEEMDITQEAKHGNCIEHRSHEAGALLLVPCACLCHVLCTFSPYMQTPGATSSLFLVPRD